MLHVQSGSRLQGSLVLGGSLCSLSLPSRLAWLIVISKVHAWQSHGSLCSSLPGTQHAGARLRAVPTSCAAYTSCDLCCCSMSIMRSMRPTGTISATLLTPSKQQAAFKPQTLSTSSSGRCSCRDGLMPVHNSLAFSLLDADASRDSVEFADALH